MTGHTLGAAGGVEAAITALALKNGVLPPTMNYQTPDPECSLNYCPNKAVELQVEAALSTSLGFGGHNVSLCLKRVD
jgi:3-oxoacyl-[acyl-carrier-protein] synthase II